ncbi:hypothetical protein DL240_04040 [Lujinxingia litoralis]|uniref:Uncharacterized protein n=1 Tax=Lujinxingia litoralis TaxID=2211119 RepID=A0A328CE46_9DELT|nr:hypothetical protein [Lujinxingia litoralis]RAL25389.1 hypothetical protein DL240_04040 [Lujinxingia litoralis]
MRSFSLSSLLLAISTLLVVGLAGPATAQAQTPPCSGTYTLDEAASDDFLAAFEPALQEMNAIKRAIARKMLKRGEGPDRRLTLRQQEGQITLQGGDRPAVTLPLNGERVAHTGENGEEVHFRARMRDEVLHVEMETEHGPIRSQYRCREGGRLDVRTRLEMEQLPRPVSYRMVYRAQ